MEFYAFERGGRLTYAYGGREYEIPAAVDVHHEVLLDALQSNLAFAQLAQAPPDMPIRDVDRLRKAYCVKSGLPLAPEEASRLFDALETAPEEIELDLQRVYGYDLVGLFRERRWRLLLSAIDRIPRTSLYYQFLLNNPESAKRIIEANKKKPPRRGTLVSETTAEVEELQELNRRVGVLSEITAGASGGKFRSERRPGMITVLHEVDHEVKSTAHQKLTARMLPHKQPVE